MPFGEYIPARGLVRARRRPEPGAPRRHRRSRPGHPVDRRPARSAWSSPTRCSSRTGPGTPSGPAARCSSCPPTPRPTPPARSRPRRWPPPSSGPGRRAAYTLQASPTGYTAMITPNGRWSIGRSSARQQVVITTVERRQRPHDLRASRRPALPAARRRHPPARLRRSRRTPSAARGAPPPTLDRLVDDDKAAGTHALPQPAPSHRPPDLSRQPPLGRPGRLHPLPLASAGRAGPPGHRLRRPALARARRRGRTSCRCRASTSTASRTRSGSRRRPSSGRWIDVLEFGLMCTAGFPEPLTFSLRVRRALAARAGPVRRGPRQPVLRPGPARGDARTAGRCSRTLHHPITVDRSPRPGPRLGSAAPDLAAPLVRVPRHADATWPARCRGSSRCRSPPSATSGRADGHPPRPARRRPDRRRPDPLPAPAVAWPGSPGGS